ncbi:MAG TPA: FHA domain-containing protein [Ktedonobacterales bacterium]|nr:FHA domain-containing protein [Ktedonobacterales bacterium]
MILCPNCLREHEDGTRFCDACGSPLQAPGAAARKTGRPAYLESLRANANGATPHLPVDAQAPVAPPATVDGAPRPATAPERAVAVSTALRVRLNSGQTFDLRGKVEYLVGRRDDEMGVSPDLDTTAFGGVDAGVSRMHALIHARQEGFFVEDLGSTNETLLNYFRLLPRQLYPLKDGDQLRFGMLQALVIIE